jgi:hypothetical protein
MNTPCQARPRAEAERRGVQRHLPESRGLDSTDEERRPHAQPFSTIAITTVQALYS